MWKLIKAEWTYYRTIILILYAFILPFLILNTVMEGFEEHLGRAVFIAVPILSLAMNREEKKYRKNPFYSKLPVPLPLVGISRLAVWVPFWLSLVFLFGLSCMIGNHDRIGANLPWILLSFASSMIIFGSFATVILDLRYCFRGMVWDKTVTVGIIFLPWIVAVVYLFATVSGPAGPYLARIFFTPAGSRTLILIAIFLLMLSGVVYNCRKSYLE